MWRVELAPRLGADVAGGHRHRLDAALAAGVGDVDGVLEEDHRIVVGEGDRAAAERARGAGDRLGRRRASVRRSDLARLADVPVLAELAGEVAAGGAEGEHRRCPGRKWLSGFFSIGSTQKPRRAPVGGQHDLAGRVGGAHEAEAALALVQLAEARADVALHAAVRQPMPVAGGDRPREGLDPLAHRSMVRLRHRPASPRAGARPGRGDAARRRIRAYHGGVRVRPPAVAGAFYPDDPVLLAGNVDGYLAGAAPPPRPAAAGADRAARRLRLLRAGRRLGLRDPARRGRALPPRGPDRAVALRPVRRPRPRLGRRLRDAARARAARRRRAHGARAASPR